MDYKKSGVNIDVGNETVRRLKKQVKKTFSKEVITGLGSFGAMYDLKIAKEFDDPVLVQSIDGVGTKMKIGKMMNRYEELGEDIVNHCCNDIVCQGARPLTFLDYVAAEQLDPNIVEAMVAGMARACQQAGISLIGGETAEMPGVYYAGEHDIAGCITGIVERDKIITGQNITAGDVILGLPSSGLHTNGFSLARKIFFEDNNLRASDTIAELQAVLGEVLLVPHCNYAKLILELMAVADLRGLAHITGGGLVENIPRILPDSLGAEIKLGSWPVLPIFDFIQKLGQVAEAEMYRVFNMGIGMVIIVSPDAVGKIKGKLKELVADDFYEIGRILPGKREVTFIQ